MDLGAGGLGLNLVGQWKGLWQILERSEPVSHLLTREVTQVISEGCGVDQVSK